MNQEQIVSVPEIEIVSTSKSPMQTRSMLRASRSSAAENIKDSKTPKAVIVDAEVNPEKAEEPMVENASTEKPAEASVTKETEAIAAEENLMVVAEAMPTDTKSAETVTETARNVTMNAVDEQPVDKMQSQPASKKRAYD